MVTGGDLRLKGNSWLRSAFQASGIGKVPREPQIRLVVAKIVKKKQLGTLACLQHGPFVILVRSNRFTPVASKNSPIAIITKEKTSPVKLRRNGFGLKCPVDDVLSVFFSFKGNCYFLHTWMTIMLRVGR